MSNSKLMPFKMLHVGGKYDDVYQLPPFAFKLWMFYFRLEGKKREGWMKREQIAAATNLNKDTVTLWRDYLVEHGWLKLVRYHFAAGKEGLKGIPVMQVRHGSIPTPTRKNKGWGTLHCTGGTSPVSASSTALAAAVVNTPTALVPPVQYCTGATSHNVDVKQIKTKADRETGFSEVVSNVVFGVVTNVVSEEKAFEILLDASRLRLEDGCVVQPKPITFDTQAQALSFYLNACDQMPRGYEVQIDGNHTVQMRAIKICQGSSSTCDNPCRLNAYDGRFCVEHAEEHRVSQEALEPTTPKEPDGEPMKRIDWSQRIPQGVLTMICGHPGVGKSTLTMLLASRRSTGLWEGVQGTAHEAWIISSEEDAPSTIVPRLMAAGADQNRIAIWKEKFTLTANITKLRESLEENPNVKLLIIDPIMNHIGSGKVERLIPRLAEVAKVTDVAIVLVTHLDKQRRFGRTDSAMGYTSDIKFLYELRNGEMQTLEADSEVEIPAVSYVIRSTEIGLPDSIGRIDFNEEPVKPKVQRASDMKPSTPPPSKDGLKAYRVSGVGWVHGESYQDAEQRVRPQYEAYLKGKCEK